MECPGALLSTALSGVAVQEGFLDTIVSSLPNFSQQVPVSPILFSQLFKDFIFISLSCSKITFAFL